eukprot:9082499-Alexandrium_andersonii.AAC.1
MSMSWSPPGTKHATPALAHSGLAGVVTDPPCSQLQAAPSQARTPGGLGSRTSKWVLFRLRRFRSARCE